MRSFSGRGGYLWKQLRSALPMLLLATLSPGVKANGASSQTGGIQGIVKDLKGNLVSHAKITSSGETPLSSPEIVMTSTSGTYEIKQLKPGIYVVSVTAAGYRTAQRGGVQVNSDAIAVANFTLEPCATFPANAGASSNESDISAGRTKFFDETGMKPAEITGSVDAGGYSASAGAQTNSRLMEGAADWSNQANPSAQNREAPAIKGLGVNPAPTESRLKKLQEADPSGFQVNHELGEFYLVAGRAASAIPYLETARRAKPADYDNDYELARAYWQGQRAQDARSLINQMMVQHDSSALHNLLAQIDSSQGNHGAALKEYERAFQMEPSEQNLYDWGLELLSHRDIEPALELFKEGVARYSQSPGLWIGLGIALYSSGHSEDAVSAFLRATDLNPSDPRPYLFLGKAYDVSKKAGSVVSDRLKRWVELEPQNAQAYYYYALSLWTGNRGGGPSPDLGRIEFLLKQSSSLDPAFPSVHLQLGNLYFEENRFVDAIAEYQEAVKLKADLIDAHYLLGQAYLRSGQKELGQQQLTLYEQLREKQRESH